MRRISIEKFYRRHRAFIGIASGYLENSNIPFLFKSCRLRPYASLFGPMEFPAKLDRWWVDEYGNSFKILKNKRNRIILNDLSIDRSKIVGTDIYENLSLADLTKVSKLAYICVAKDDYIQNDFFIVSFLGNDNFFRTRVFCDGKWIKNISTLYLGLPLLMKIIKKNNIKYFMEISSKSTLPKLPLQDATQWVTHWPPHDNFVDTLKRKSKTLTEQLINFQGE